MCICELFKKPAPAPKKNTAAKVIGIVAIVIGAVAALTATVAFVLKKMGYDVKVIVSRSGDCLDEELEEYEEYEEFEDDANDICDITDLEELSDLEDLAAIDGDDFAIEEEIEPVCECRGNEA